MFRSPTQRLLAVSTLICTACFLLRCDRSDGFTGNEDLRNLAIDGGFLIDVEGMAIHDYALAVHEITRAGITYASLKSIESETGMELDKDLYQTLEKAANHVQRGAQQKRVDLPRLSEYATVFELPTLQVDIADLRLAAIACKVLADENRKNGDFGQSFRLGRAMIAAGLHFEGTKNELVRTIGIVFKEHGLKVVYATAADRNDDALQQLCQRLLRLVDAEFHSIRNNSE